MSEARSAAAAFEPADVIQDGVGLRLEDEVAAATLALGLRRGVGFDGCPDLRTEFEELAEDEEHPAATDGLHELVDLVRGPFGELTTFYYVLADFLEVVGLAEVLDFADREILIDEGGPGLADGGHVEPSHVQQPVGVDVPATLLVGDLDADTPTTDT